MVIFEVYHCLIHSPDKLLGSASYTAVYSGDTSYQTSTSSGSTYVIKLASTTSLAISPAATAEFGTEVTLTATITTGTSAPEARGPEYAGATVAFKRAGTAITGCSAVTVTTGSAQCKTSSLAAGTANYTAEYSGDSTNAASTSSAVSYIITSSNVATTTVLTISPDQSGILYVNQIATFTVTVTPASGSGTPTGSVSIMQGALELCTITLSGGTGSCTYTFSTTGLKTVYAAYAGAAGFDASDSAGQDVTVRNRIIFPFLIFNGTN